MTSERRVCLGLAYVKRYKKLHTLGSEARKAWVPKEQLCHGTGSRWLTTSRLVLTGTSTALTL